MTNCINIISIFHVTSTYYARATIIVFVIIVVNIIIFIIFIFVVFVIITVIIIIIIILQIELLFHRCPRPSCTVRYFI
jgi:hypothetical protein